MVRAIPFQDPFPAPHFAGRKPTTVIGPPLAYVFRRCGTRLPQRSSQVVATSAAITSVGPVTVALSRAMSCSDEVALATGWRLWNCSVTECVFSGDRFTLDSFNSLPHLPDRREWTYR